MKTLPLGCQALPSAPPLPLSPISNDSEAYSPDRIPEGRDTAADTATAEDVELVRRFNTGDDTAFVEIDARYRRKMFVVALSLIRNRADAEEISQDTFIRAHKGLANFRGDSSLASWLYRITVNLARNRYWYFFRRHRHETQSFDSVPSYEGSTTLADSIASNALDPARDAMNREFAAQVKVCMRKLNPGEREILTLRNFEDLSYLEIAESLSIAVGTVKSRIGRARSHLHGLLTNLYDRGSPSTSSPPEWFEAIRSSGRLDCSFA